MRHKARAGPRLLFLVLCAVLLATFSGRAEAEPTNPLLSVVRIEAHVPGDSRTASRLGTERAGAGVVIAGDGLILTIGYLILEADEVAVTDRDGRRFPAEIVAYDHATGFGLLRAHEGLDVPAVALGVSGEIEHLQTLLAASVGPVPAHPVQVRAVKPFAGGWEYLIEGAVFTVPPISEFGGAALFGEDGRLLGIGSLILGDAGGSGEAGNMFVPIDLLKPVLGDLLAFGRSTEPARPWVGIYPAEIRGYLVVSGLAEGGPGASAGLERGDLLIAVGEEPVKDMEGFFRAIWALGPAGTRVPLTVLRDGSVFSIEIESRDRHDWLKLGRTY
ncbi:S1C family serine protease [Nisaea acidiphila]|uniref:S1C family serine protease n=1 Tax=Nisaea acidiphila TaxID=1862145 RepID=A0A9J7B097_9PROT|nr:S1C family serine protease [Nisaea acidiphila]UUX51908.1 S1C family serine protease [Nisaea acidiphila]